MGGFLFGFDTAVISGVEKSIQELFKLSPFWHGFTIASALIGTIVGALAGGVPADKYGRKPVLIAIASLFLVSAVGSALAPSLLLFILFRFLGGIAVGASSVVAPMYISEIAPASSRGRMTALFQFDVIAGILVAYLSNYWLSNAGADAWRWMLGAGALPAAVNLLLLWLVPESPLFLIRSGKEEQAIDVLSRIYGDGAAFSLEGMGRQSRVEKGNLFSGKFSRPIALAFLVAAFNQFSGINAILYYAPRIFELTGISSKEAFLQPVMIGVTNAASTLLGMLVIDKVGRKKLLIAGSIGMSVCLGLVARSFYLRDFEGYSLLILLVLYIVFFAFSTGAVIWVLISEVFPASVRGQGQSLGSFTHWFFAALITFVFPIIVEGSPLGAGHAFAFFSVMMLIQAITVWQFFPETKGKTLEELSSELSERDGDEVVVGSARTK